MPWLDKTIALLNDSLVQNALCFTTPGKVAAYGICETMLKEVNGDGTSSQVRYPAMVDDDGEGQMVEVDDIYDVILYHRVDSITNGISRTGFGDSPGDPVETANCVLTLFFFRKKVKKTAQQLEAAVKDKFPDTWFVVNDDNGSPVQSSQFIVGNSSFNKLSILEKEYPQVILNYPDLSLFQMNYRIESTWKRGCLSLC